MARTFRVIDLFAGPGGLAEGFSSVMNEADCRVFDIALSVEKDDAAHGTLTLRAFTRQFGPCGLPSEYYAFGADRLTLDELKDAWPEQWRAAEKEAQKIELGTSAGNRRANKLLDGLVGDTENGAEFIVIGGPPCQAYSLVGRARNRGIAGYEAAKDKRHFLYREYIKILERVRPAAFVMENVKGMLSSTVAGREIFRRVRSDLEEAGGSKGSYRLLALSPSGTDLFPGDTGFANSDFVLRSERHGVPQARHRVIIVGFRRDVFEALPQSLSGPLLEDREDTTTVRHAISDLPVVRSALSHGDSDEAWSNAVADQMEFVCQELRDSVSAPETVRRVAVSAREKFSSRNRVPERKSTMVAGSFAGSDELADFLLDKKLESLSDHEARGHMKSDLGRYFYAACFAEATGRSPKAADFPDRLAPAHANWGSGQFADRFRVQAWDAPATTVVSHISKDGHYYIHPDPVQCRSLTPREAARLQTFPDNYIFLGNRTQRYHQIGNAVPPFLAKQIAEVLQQLLENALPQDS